MGKYGSKIRELREKNGDTREVLAKKLNITESALGKYERDERNIKPELLKQVADLYGVKVSHFYGEEGELPKELKEIGVEWIAFAKEMKEKKLTPEQIKAAVEFLDKMGITKK